jgi:signal transduction histidine kinase
MRSFLSNLLGYFNADRRRALNMSKGNCFYFLFMLCMYMPAMSQTPPGLGRQFTSDLDLATFYMNESQYDSAQSVVSEMFRQTNYPLSDLELYYLHSYEAEIMYYNAIFEQGLNTSLRALEIALKLGDSTIIGNAENLMGLFLLSLNRNSEAIPYFRNAIMHIPEDQNKGWLTYRYQAYNNMAESYLKLSMADSAEHFANLGLEGSTKWGRTRGMAIAHWTISESQILKGNYRAALDEARSSYQLMFNEPHRDVIQMACAAYMKSYVQLDLKDSALFWMETGLRENDDPRNTDFSRLWFLQQAVNSCVQLDQLERGVMLLDQLNKIHQDVNFRQRAQQISILEDYFEKNQKLLLADQMNTAQLSELKLRNRITLISSVLAFILLITVILAVRFFRQRRRIEQLEHFEQMKIQQNELEIKAIETRLKAIELERNRIASDLHDDIGAALSSIRIYGMALEHKHETNPDEAKLLIEKITSTSTGMMERMSDIVWSIHPKNDGGESLVLRMKSYGSEVLGSSDIVLNYKIGKETVSMQFNMLARKNLYLIFKEAVNNISKYSMAKHVSIEFRVVDGMLIFNIADDGVGFNVVQASGGNGLRSMNQRVESMGGKLHIVSHHVGGTRLECSIKLTSILIS